MQESNPWALQAISERLLEAADRGLWSEPDPEDIDGLKQAYLEAEGLLEDRS
jgi:cobaltochelatase CobN